MTSDSVEAPAARRAYRQQLRAISRLLRWTGIGFVLLGAVGILLGYSSGKWFMAPSCVSFLLGWALILSAVTSRARPVDIDPPQNV